MTLATKSTWTIEPAPQRPAAALWKFLPFLVLGVAGSIVGGYLVIGKGVNLGLVSLALLLVIPLTWGSWIGAKEVWKVIGAFRSKLVWWHWVWLLSITSSFVFRYRSASEISSNPFDALAAFRVIPEVIVGVILLGRLAFRRPDWLPSMFRGLVGILAVFGLVCLTSSIWSVKASWTSYKSLEYLLDLSIVAVILATITTSEQYKTFIDWTWVIAGGTLAWVWIGLPIWPEQTMGTEGRLTGAFPTVSSNEIGEVGAILMMIALIRIWPVFGVCKNRAFYILTFLLGAASMVAAETRSAIGGVAVAGIVVLFFMRRTKVAVIATILGFPVVLFTGLGDKIMHYLQRDQSQAEMMSLSSRLDWWSVGYNMFMQHPLTGLGAYAGSRFAVMKKVGDVPQLHSDWLEVIVGTSIWGLIPLTLALVGTWMVLVTYVRRRTLEPIDQQLAIEMIGVLVITTIHSFFNVEMTWHHPTLYLMVLGYAEFLRRKMKDRPRQTVGVRSDLEFAAQRR